MRNPVDHPLGGRTRGGVAKDPKGRLITRVTKKKYNALTVITARQRKFVTFQMPMYVLLLTLVFFTENNSFL